VKFLLVFGLLLGLLLFGCTMPSNISQSNTINNPLDTKPKIDYNQTFLANCTEGTYTSYDGGVEKTITIQVKSQGCWLDVHYSHQLVAAGVSSNGYSCLIPKSALDECSVLGNFQHNMGCDISYCSTY
jgi:hypothetical protein